MNHSPDAREEVRREVFTWSDHKGCWGSFDHPLCLEAWSASWMRSQLCALLLSGPDASAWLLTISTSKSCSLVRCGGGCDVLFLVDSQAMIKGRSLHE